MRHAWDGQRVCWCRLGTAACVHGAEPNHNVRHVVFGRRVISGKRRGAGRTIILWRPCTLAAPLGGWSKDRTLCETLLLLRARVGSHIIGLLRGLTHVALAPQPRSGSLSTCANGLFERCGAPLPAAGAAVGEKWRREAKNFRWREIAPRGPRWSGRSAVSHVACVGAAAARAGGSMVPAWLGPRFWWRAAEGRRPLDSW